MNVNEVLQFVDNLVVEKTGKHLDDIQKAIIEGSWQRQSYSDIAEKYHITEGYAGDVASELWKLLSEALGEDIKKSNFRSTFERLNIELCANSNIYINGINNGFYHLETSVNHNQVNPKNKKNNNKNDKNSQYKSSYYDLTFAPQIFNFYNRETELKTLYNWICRGEQPFAPTRLICILGMSGIGKTTLVKRFVDLNLDQFEVIIWKSLKLTPSLNQIITEILTTQCRDVKFYVPTDVSQFLNLLKERRCLIIFDNVENIFIPGQFAGQYQTEFQDYQNFFTNLIEAQHQSNIILISQEKCQEMEYLDQELSTVKCLELSGLDSSQILSDFGLKDEDCWLKLINLYEGNLFYLKTIANSIKNIYNGNVAEFLAENQDNYGTKILPVLPTQIKIKLQILFDKLSFIEQQIVIKLSNSEQFLSRKDLKISLNLSSTDLINGIESLQQRFLITKITGDKILFKLSPVFGEYVKNCCQD